MGNYNFKEDLVVAQENEAKIAEMLSNESGFICESGNDTSSHDISCHLNDNFYKIECKEDFQVGRTGNVAVEIECRGKPSGIEISQSDFWVYTLHRDTKEVWIMTTASLRKAIKHKKYFTKCEAGDLGTNGQVARICLFDYETFTSLGKYVGELE